jgi:hypothetical protein
MQRLTSGSLTSRSASLLLGALALLAACGESPTTPSSPLAPTAPLMVTGGGNSLNAKSCQKNGWQSLVTSTGATFASETACTSYAAKGGTLYRKQTITFTSTNPSPANVGTTYTPTATATSGLTVAITLDAASTGCSLSSGVVSFTAVGTCVVNANQAGDANYAAAAQVQQSITTRVACIGSDVTLRAAAAAGGSYSFCTAGAHIVLTGGQVTVGTTLTLTAIGGTNAIVDGNHASRVFLVASSGSLTLSDVTVTGGHAAVAPDRIGGGGIAIQGGAVTLDGNAKVDGNEAVNGGGVIVGDQFAGGSLTLNDASAVSNNVSAELGTGYGSGGGGVYLNNGSLVMNGTSSVRYNTVFDAGGARGGGVLVGSASVTLNGTSSISDNTAAAASVASTSLGGGIYFSGDGTLTFGASTSVTRNSAGFDGGGIYRIDHGFGTITVPSTSIITGNTPNNCANNSFAPPVPNCQ